MKQGSDMNSVHVALGVPGAADPHSPVGPPRPPAFVVQSEQLVVALVPSALVPVHGIARIPALVPPLSFMLIGTTGGFFSAALLSNTFVVPLTRYQGPTFGMRSNALCVLSESHATHNAFD